jgi:hypothetical protein
VSCLLLQLKHTTSSSQVVSDTIFQREDSSEEERLASNLIPTRHPLPTLKVDILANKAHTTTTATISHITQHRSKRSRDGAERRRQRRRWGCQRRAHGRGALAMDG